LSNWIAKLSGVRPEEGSRTLWATLFYFFFVAHVVMVKSASNALFLSRHNPQNLPYLYILVAAAVAVIVLFASNTLADPRRRMLRLTSLASVSVILVGCWALLFFDLLPASPFVYLFAEVAATALNIQFWSVAGDIFDPQEGKRVFGILAGGGMSGSIFGGLFVRYLSPHLGAVSLLLTAAGALAFSLAAAWVLTKHQGHTDSLPSKKAPSLRAGLKYVFANSYPRTFGLVMLVGMVLTSFVDYLFRTSARELLAEDQLAVLFGDLNVWVGLISVAFLFLFANRILRRIGIFYYLLLVPAGMVAASMVSIFVPVFLVVYALKIIENSGSMSINQAALQLMYNPVRIDLRAPARGVIDGLMRKLGYAVGGGLLLLLAPLLAPPAWQMIIIGLVVVLCALLLRLRVLYVNVLFDRLKVGATEKVGLRLEDASSHLALLKGLESDDESMIVTSLELLSEVPGVDIQKNLRLLVEHPAERVRIAAIAAIAARGHKEFLFDLLGVINGGTRRCRVAAMGAVVALDAERASGALAPYLRSEDPGLVAAAIEHLLRLRGFSADNPAIEVFEALLDKGAEATPAQRRETAKLLGHLGQSRYALHLTAYLADPSPSVRRLAALSCRRVRRMEFVPRLMQMLKDREVRVEAREALAAYGDQVLDLLEEWLNDLDRPLSVRLRLPRVIRLIGTQRAGEVLLFSNIQDHAILRYRIALALSGIRSSPDIRFDRKWALAAVDRRFDAYNYYAELYQKLSRHLAHNDLVLRVLRDRLGQNIEVAFRVLGLVYSHRTLMSIHHRLKNASREIYQDALELLDTVIDLETRYRLIPLLEKHAGLLAAVPRAKDQVGIAPIREVLLTLSDSKDVLLRAVAVHTRCLLGDDCTEKYPVLFKGVSTMDVMEKVLFLESVDIFGQNNLDDLTALAAIAKEKQFAKGDSILREGEPGDALYIITKGQVEIKRGTRRLLKLGERTSLGGVSLLDQKPHAASAVCLEGCDTLVIDRTDFMDLVSDRVELLHGIFLALTDRLRALLAVTEGGGLTEEEYDDGPTNPV
jgi:ATP/ADP translocase/HEAT repeat protein